MSLLFSDINFYKKALLIALPIMIQNAVTSFVGLLDNLMVGQTGTMPMSGVSIANQIINIYTITTFGAMAAVGIFMAQYSGKKDRKGILYCFKLKFFIACLIGLAAIIILYFFNRPLVSLFLMSKENDPSAIAATLNYGTTYLQIMVPGIVLFAFSQVFSTSLRECGNTVVGMISSVTVLLVNCFLNWCLIFGKLGFPVLGSNGAAYATVISRVIEFLILAGATYFHRRLSFLYEFVQVGKTPAELLEQVFLKGSPLLVNEVMYSVGQAALAQRFATRGLEVVAAYNIYITVSEVFFIANYALGVAASIMTGQALGKGEDEEARKTAVRMMFANVIVCSLFGLALGKSAAYFPLIYNTSDSVRAIATSFLVACAWHLPLQGVTLTCYFVMRSGGKSMMTLFFDSFSVVFVMFPLAYVLTAFTDISALGVLIAIYSIDVLKLIGGLIIVAKGYWVQNIVNM